MATIASVEIIAKIETELDPDKMGVSNNEEALIVLRAATTSAFKSIFGDKGSVKVNIETHDDTDINIG